MIVECLANGCLALFLVVEEHEVLSLLLVGATGDIDGLHGVGVDAGVVHLGAEGHGRRREVLYLLEAVAQPFHLDGKVGHVFELAAGVRADEIRNQLVAETCLATDGVKLCLGLEEEVEGRLAHKLQHMVAGMLGSHLETAADMVQHHMAEVVPAAILLGKEVTTDAATDIDMLDAGESGNLLIEFDKRTVVGLEVFAYSRLYAAVARAAAAVFLVLARHTVHVGGGASEVGDDTVKVFSLGECLHLAEDRGFRTGGYLLALMG